MIFLWVLTGIVVLVVLLSLCNWWRDEQEKLGKVAQHPTDVSRNVIPAITSSATPLHPTIDPYLADLRRYLLQEPLPTGPGDMANRAYTHLNQWLNNQADPNVVYDNQSQLETTAPIEQSEPAPRFRNMSRNDPVPPPGYLENIGKEIQ